MSLLSSKPNCITERTLIEWGNSESGNLCCLGTAEDDLQMTVCLDINSTSELFLWFCLPVKVKLYPQARNPRQKLVYFVLQADMFDHTSEEPCLSIQTPGSFTSAQSTIVALANASLGPDNAVHRMRFKLKAPGNIFMPQAQQPLIPTSEKASNALAALRDLSQAKDFFVYIALQETYPVSVNWNEKTPLGLLGNVCEKLSAGEIQNHITDYTSCDWYKEGVVCNAWEMFDLHRNVRSVSRNQQKISTTGKNYALDFPPPLYTESGDLSNNKQKSSSEAFEVEVDYPGDRSCERLEDTYDLRSETNDPPGLSLDQEDIETEDDGEDGLEIIPGLDVPKPNSGVISQKGSLNNAQRSSIKRAASISSSRSHHGPKKVRFISPESGSKSQSLRNASNADASRPHTSDSKSISLALRGELVEFMHWLVNVDSRLEKQYDTVLWSLGEAASKSDTTLFRKVKFDCKAEVLCTYRKRKM